MSEIVNDIVEYLTAGENLVDNDALYVSDGTGNDSGRTAGRAYKLDVTNKDRRKFVGFAKGPASTAAQVKYAYVGRKSGFSALTQGNILYASITVPGSYQVSEPTSNSLAIGVAMSATKVLVGAGLAGAFKLAQAYKNNLIATVAPTVSDDNTANYSAGSMWYNQTNDTIYMCESSGTGAAVWQGISGGGGGTTVYPTDFNIYTLGDADSAVTGDFTTGNNATFDGGGTFNGTFSVSTTSTDLIRGTKSFKWVGSATAGNNTNDYIASTNIAVPQGYRGKLMLLKLRYRFDGATANMKLVVKDSTNSTILSSNLDSLTQYIDATNYTSAEFQTLVTVPPSCANLKVGFQCITGEVSKTLVWDDFVITSNIAAYSSLRLKSSEVRLQGYTGLGSTDTAIVRFTTQNILTGSGMSQLTNAANGTIITILRPGILNISATLNSTGGGGGIRLSKNQTTLTSNPTADENISSQYYNSGVTTLNVCGSVKVVAGDKIRLSSTMTPAANDDNHIHAVLEEDSDNIIIPTNTFSSDANVFAFKATAIIDTDPIGTFNTYTYVASANTPTISGSAPTQTVASMNANGIQIFARAFNATSTAASPTRVDVYVGKNLKNTTVNGYFATSKATPFWYDVATPNSSTQVGTNTSYSETTGILTLNAGIALNGSNTDRQVGEDGSGTQQTNGYFVINASRIQPNVAIPVAQTVYLKDVKSDTTAGGTFTSGAWRTRDLNTIEGDSGIVTLSANQFTLLSGNYIIEAYAPAYNCQGHKIKLRNITDSSDTIIGQSSYQENNSVNANLIGSATITSSKTFEIQHRCVLTSATYGFGSPNSFGTGEIYTTVKITKIK